MKTCTKCNETYDDIDANFYKRGDSSRYRSHCKKCVKDKNGDSDKIRRWRHNVKNRLVEYWGSKCIDCGFEGPGFCFDFDHRDPSQKEFQISHYKWGYSKMLEETKKCDLVCAVCHRKRTHKQRCQDESCVFCLG